MKTTSLPQFVNTLIDMYNADACGIAIQTKTILNNQGKKMIEFISGQGKAEQNMGNAPFPPAFSSNNRNGCN